MRRRLFTLALFLLLGAVVNVAVAWGCVVWATEKALPSLVQLMSPGTRRSQLRQGPFLADRFLRRQPPQYPTGYVDGIIAWQSTGLWLAATLSYEERWDYEKMNWEYWGGLQWVDGKQPRHLPYRIHYLLLLDAGWPVRGMTAANYKLFEQRGSPPTWVEIQDKTIGARKIRESATALDPDNLFFSKEEIPILLPLCSAWPGFAVNTIFYATILWPLISGPFALRRIIRRKHGLCVTCGYDLSHADHAACPECGAVGGRAAGATGWAASADTMDHLRDGV